MDERKTAKSFLERTARESSERSMSTTPGRNVEFHLATPPHSDTTQPFSQKGSVKHSPEALLKHSKEATSSNFSGEKNRPNGTAKRLTKGQKKGSKEASYGSSAKRRKRKSKTKSKGSKEIPSSGGSSKKRANKKQKGSKELSSGGTSVGTKQSGKSGYDLPTAVDQIKPSKEMPSSNDEPRPNDLVKKPKKTGAREPASTEPSDAIQIVAKPGFFNDLLAWVNEFETLLTTKKGFIEFGGIAEDPFVKSCAHVTLKNQTNRHLIYHVRAPKPNYFSVTPRLDVIEPNSKKTFYCTFNGNLAPGIPPDAAFSYTVFHFPLTEQRASWLKQKNPESDSLSSRMRMYWRRHYTQYQMEAGGPQMLLRLPVCFIDERLPEKLTCDSHRHRDLVKPIVCVDDKKMDEPTYEAGKHSARSDELPSAQE